MSKQIRDIGGQVDPVLSTLAVGYMNAPKIANQVAPLVPVVAPSGTIFSFGKEGFKIYDTDRALGANANLMKFKQGVVTYQTRERALANFIDNEELKAAEKYGTAQILQLRRRRAKIISRALDTKHEKEVATACFDADNYATANKVTLSGTDQWTDKTNSTPIDDIEAAKEQVRACIGVEPNTLTIGYKAFKALKTHPTILSIFENVKAKIITIEMLKEALDIENINVGKAVSSDDADDFEDIWGDSCSLSYVPSVNDVVEGTPVHIITLTEQDTPEVREFPQEEGTKLREKRKYVVKVINTSHAYLIADCCA